MHTCLHCDQEFTVSFAFYCPRCGRKTGHAQTNNGMIVVSWLDTYGQASAQYKQMTVKTATEYPDVDDITERGSKVVLDLSNGRTIDMKAVDFFNVILSDRGVLEI